MRWFRCSGAGSREEAIKISAFGIAIPLFLATLVIDHIDAAVLHTQWYRPSLTPNIAMALWGGASERALRWSMLIAAITSLGALRFCAMAIMALSSVGPFARRRWIPAGASIIAIAALTVHDFAVLWLPFEIAATVLGIAAGILMADWRRTDLRPDRWIDLPAAGAFVAALLIFAWIREIWSASAWTRAWVFPCYLVALMTVWILRRISRPSPGPA